MRPASSAGTIGATMLGDTGHRPNRDESRRKRPDQAPELLEGRIRRVVFQAPETSYSVLEVETPQGQVVSAVGTMPSPMPGETVRLSGTWEVHARWGRQFRFEDFELLRPATAEGLALYLADTIPGIGRELARRLVEHFGSKTVEALDEGAERLREVPGIGPKKAAALAKAWQEHRHVHELMSYLRSLGLSPSLASRVYRVFGPHAIEVIERHPYRLARRVRGVGFLTADRLARRAGLPADDPERLQAGLMHVLGEAISDGHLFLPQETLIERASELLGAPAERVEQQLQALVEQAEVVVEKAPDGEVACYLPAMMSCERRVAWLLRSLAAHKPTAAPRPAQAQEWLQRFEAYASLELNDDQRQALLATCENSVSVITGGPGTGKTLVTRAITWVWRRTGRKVALCAPTGRAAKRLEEVTGHEAVTIHRLLGYRPDGTFVHGPDEPLPYDLVVVDETSMVDMLLAASLLGAVNPGTSLVLVGDADQLPPVGPGAFFGEIVNSRALPVVRFTQIYRQAERSLIVANAHRLVRGEPPRLPTPETWHGEDMLWVDVERELAAGHESSATADGQREDEALSLRSQEIALEKITNAVVRNLPRLGFAADDVQVLSPMRRGLLGVENLNLRLQE
ncbi:MAG: AAA family ATPase, partial [Armatimonadetes bacterium]|nr:AAA family ATPase [Armatimonadota bacterium]